MLGQIRCGLCSGGGACRKDSSAHFPSGQCREAAPLPCTASSAAFWRMRQQPLPPSCYCVRPRRLGSSCVSRLRIAPRSACLRLAALEAGRWRAGPTFVPDVLPLPPAHALQADMVRHHVARQLLSSGHSLARKHSGLVCTRCRRRSGRGLVAWRSPCIRRGPIDPAARMVPPPCVTADHTVPRGTVAQRCSKVQEQLREKRKRVS